MKTEAEIITDGFPAKDGYFMPGEFEPHQGCILIWPERPGSWIYGAKGAREAFCNVIAAIAESETVYVAASETAMESAKEMLSGDMPWQKNVRIFQAETDDAWARDVAPTFVIKKDHKTGSINKVRAVNWSFNAWGGTVDGLYASWEKDDAFAKFFAAQFDFPIYDASPFVLEGGSIHSDGEGTVMVTESCLLSAGRNPGLSKGEIEARLKQYLGAEKILWLPRGIYMDETNEHVDNVCAFLRPGEVVLAWTDDENDPQYPLSKESLAYLEGERDAKGRKLLVHKLPIPKHPVCITQYELDGYTFAAGEDEREAGERLAASYVNFYFSNGAVVMPAFGGENEDSDKQAAEILQKLCPGRKVISVYARDILVGGGNIHCITQQIPG
jgi:agmatine deiminase